MLRDQLRRTAAVAARERAEAYGITATYSADVLAGRVHCFAASPPRYTRVATDHGTGWVNIVSRTILVRATQGLTVTVGSRFTVIADYVNPDTAATVWQIRELTGSDSGSELRALCHRVDS